jgi:diaminopimelate decarboxylase
MSELTDTLMNDLGNKYQTPFYVMERRSLNRSLESFRKAFDGVHSGITIAYPYKTNNLREVIKHFHSLGLWAEVTSEIELAMAEQLGVPGSKIIFNGPLKTYDELMYSCKRNILIFIDNEPELYRVEKVANELSLFKHPIGIRVNSTKGGGTWSKFGFDIDDSSALNAARYISSTTSLNLVGIHAHFASNMNDLNLYQRLMERLSDFLDQLTTKGLLDLKYLDLGSGFPITSPQPEWAKEWLVPPIDAYANVIKNCFKQLPRAVRLIVEPGRILVANACTLLTRVIAVKPGVDKLAVIVDSGVNMLPGRDHYRYQVRSLRTDGDLTACDILGSLCSNYDIMAVDVKIPKPKVGDILLILHTGAYDLVRSFTWNLPLPPVVIVEDDGTNHIIRRRETVHDVWNTQFN